MDSTSFPLPLSSIMAIVGSLESGTRVYGRTSSLYAGIMLSLEMRSCVGWSRMRSGGGAGAIAKTVLRINGTSVDV